MVLSGHDLEFSQDDHCLPPDKIALVNEVCDRTGAAIVVSSTWRMNDEAIDQLRAAGLRAFHPDWRTARGKRSGNSYVEGTRGDEIADWLRDHPEVSSTCYAIVDDEEGMLPDQIPQFVRTTFATGLDRSNVEQLVHCLNRTVRTDGLGWAHPQESPIGRQR